MEEKEEQEEGKQFPEVRYRHSLSPTTHVQYLFAAARVFFISFVSW